MAKSVPGFVCPSDPSSFSVIPPTFGGNNYVWNYGSDIQFFSPTGSGAFVFGNVSFRLTDIRDGTSNTAAFSERRKGDFNNGMATPETDLMTPPGSPATADDAANICASFDAKNLSYQWRSDYGATWIQAYHWTLYQHVGLPNARGCAFPPANCSMAANSAHVNGVNVLLCDGSVRFINNTISMPTWRAMGTRVGQDILGSDW